MINKKAQEEIVGFVAIILVVTVIGLLLLGISLQKTPDNQVKSTEIGTFLDSAMLYTSDCASGYEPNYLSLKDLMSDCYIENGKQCVDGRSVCIVLNQTVKDLLNRSWPVGPDRDKKGYEFKVIYDSNITSNETSIMELAAGNCSSGSYQQGDSFFSSYPGVITSTFKICY